jgi:hypothetical protein
MKTVADPEVLGALVRRLSALQPHTPRRWGTMTASEMLCHLGDAEEMVLRTRPRLKPVPIRRRALVKAFFLWTPVRFPHGVPTNPMHDPRADGTKPSEFARDLARAIAGLEAIASASPASLEPVHGMFGRMTVTDWRRWAWKHTDHHLRQFGV